MFSKNTKEKTQLEIDVRVAKDTWLLHEQLDLEIEKEFWKVAERINRKEFLDRHC